MLQSNVFDLRTQFLLWRFRMNTFSKAFVLLWPRLPKSWLKTYHTVTVVYRSVIKATLTITSITTLVLKRRDLNIHDSHTKDCVDVLRNFAKQCRQSQITITRLNRTYQDLSTIKLTHMINRSYTPCIKVRILIACLHTLLTYNRVILI